MGMSFEVLWIPALLVLAGALVYALRQRPLSRKEREGTDEAVRRNFDKERLR